MKKISFIILIFFFFQSNLIASNKKNITVKLNKIKNISFNFVQTISDKDEKGECTIKYPKKIYCKYEARNNKILVSNGSNLVIKNNKQYYRYPVKSTPFEFLLDKSFLIRNIKNSELKYLEEKYLFLEIKENNKNLKVFFSIDNFEIVGWQVEDVYQNLAVTYIFDLKSNKKINKKIFNLPKND